MNLWKTRDRSFKELEGPLRKEAELIEDMFSIIDNCINRLSKLKSNKFAIVCGFTLSKSRNLLLGNYSLILDNFPQEAGALLRTLIETYEALVYYRLEPGRVQEAIDDKLPRAGNIAKAIKGNFHDLRKYLNAFASHYSFSKQAMTHLMDPNSQEIRTGHPFSSQVLKNNLTVFFAFSKVIATEAINCLHIAQPGAANDLDVILKEKFQTAQKVFDFKSYQQGES